MGTTGQEQSKEVDLLKDTLGNNKLDSKELSFLKSQDKLLLDFKEDAEVKLLNDIAETNKKSFAKDEKVRMFLNSFLLKPEAFADQLVKIKKLPDNEVMKKGVVNLLKTIYAGKGTEFDKQIYIVKILFDVYNNTFNRKNRVNVSGIKTTITNQKTMIFDMQLAKDIHAFQKKYAQYGVKKGRSDVDCIIGMRTIQQLCAADGITPGVEAVKGDVKFTQSSLTEKDKYVTAKDIRAQFEAVSKDVGLSNVEKVQAMIKVRDRTTAEKKYAATSYFMSFTQDILAKSNASEQREINDLIAAQQGDISKYWNADESNELVEKSDDIINDANKGVEKKEKRLDTLKKFLKITNVWLQFYDDQCKHNFNYEQIQKEIQEGTTMLTNLMSSDTINNDAMFQLTCDRAVKKIFHSTQEIQYGKVPHKTEQQNGSGFTASLANTKPSFKSGFSATQENNQKGGERSHNDQIALFASMANLLMKGDISSISNGFSEIIRAVDIGAGGNTLEALDISRGGMILEAIQNGESFSSSVNHWFDGFKGNIDKNNDLYKLFKGNIEAVNNILTKEENISKLVPIVESDSVDKGLLAKTLTGMGLVLSPEIMDKLVSALIEHKQKILDKMEYRYAEILAERKSSIGKSIVSNTGDIAVYQKELDYAQSTGNTQKVEEYTTKIAQLQEAIKGQKEILANPYKKLYPVAPGEAPQSLMDIVKEQYRAEVTLVYLNTVDRVFAEPVLLMSEGYINNVQKNHTEKGNLDLFMDINGIGKYISDKLYNNISEVVQFVAEVVISIATMGAASAVSGVIKGISIAARIARYVVWGVTFTLLTAGVEAMKGNLDVAKDMLTNPMTYIKNIAMGAVIGSIGKLFTTSLMTKALRGIKVGEKIFASRAQNILHTLADGVGLTANEYVFLKIEGQDMSMDDFLTAAGQMIALGILFRGKSIIHGNKSIEIGGTKFTKTEVRDFLTEANKIDENILGSKLSKAELEKQRVKVEKLLETADGKKKTFFTEIKNQLDNRIVIEGKKQVKKEAKENKKNTTPENKSPENKKPGTENVVEQVINKTDTKYEKALDGVKDGEIITMDIGAKNVSFKKNGETYELYNNQAGIRNVRGDSYFRKGEIVELLKTSENNIRTEIETGILDVKYDKALDLMGNKEIVIEIDGKTVRFQKKGDIYELMFNQAGIKNARGDRYFTKAEVRDLLKSGESTIKTEIIESDIIAKYEKVITEHQNKEIVIEIDGKTVRFQKKGDIYELMFNQAGIKNARGDRYFTKAEVIELAKNNSSNLSIEGVRIEEIEMVINESEVLSSTPEAIVAKSEIKGLLARVKEFFKRPEESKIKEVEKEIENKEAEIISNKTSPEIKKAIKDFLQKIKDLFAKRKQKWTREKTNKPQAPVIENKVIEAPKTMDELIDIVEQQGPVEAYKQGKVETDGSVSPSGDKKIIKSEEIVKDINEGNFEDLNFQKGDKMLKLRQEGVDLYIKEKINSVEDLLDFVQKNPKLFGGVDKQASLISELTKEGKTDVQKLEQFNKKVQDKYSGISGPNSKTGFDMKSMIENKVNELKSKIEISVESAGDPNLLYFDNVVLDKIGKITPERVKDAKGNQEIKKTILDYFKINKADVNLKNIEVVYDEVRGGIVIKTKSLYEQMLIGERQIENKNAMIKNKDFIVSIEKKALEVIDKNKETLQNLSKVDVEAAKQMVLDQIRLDLGSISEFQETLLNSLLINTGGAPKYSVSAKINGPEEYSVKVGDADIITMLDSPLSNLLIKFGGEKSKYLYNDILNHEFQHQQTMDYRNKLLVGEIKGIEGEIPNTNSDLEGHLFHIKDEVVSHLWNTLTPNRTIDFSGIEKNLTKITNGIYGYPGPFAKSPGLMSAYTAKIQEYLNFVKENYAKDAIKNGEYYPSKDAILDIMKKLYTTGPDVKIHKKINMKPDTKEPEYDIAA